MRSAAVLGVAICLAASVTPAQPAHRWAPWVDGPAGFLLTDGERTELAALTDEAEIARFIALFWARRDPDLSTRANEFRLDFEARVAAADRQFAEGETRGSLSDRGRVLLLLGAPARRRGGQIAPYLDAIYREPLPEDGVRRNRLIGEEWDLRHRLRNQYGLPARSTLTEVAPDAKFRDENAPDEITTRHGVRFHLAKGMVEEWTFAPDQLPAALAGSDEPLALVFFDCEGTGVWQLATQIRGADRGTALLAALPARLVAHPALENPPQYPLLPGGAAATTAQLVWFEQDESTESGGFPARLVRGVRAPGDYPLWVTLDLPADVRQDGLVVGRLVGQGGLVEGTFQADVAALTQEASGPLELQIPASAAPASLELALATADGTVVVRRLEVEAAPADPQSPFITSITAGAEVTPLASYEAGSPFVFGGYHLAWRSNGRFAADEDLAYFCLLANPGLDGGGVPSVRVSMRLFRTGEPRPTFATVRRPVQASAAAPGVFMIGSQIPLSALPGPGAYRLEIDVHDVISTVERSTSFEFVIEDGVSATSS